MGVITTPIQRSKEKVQPTLEKHVFVPNETAISLEASIRVNMQIVLECSEENTIKLFEIIDEETPEGFKTLSAVVIEVFNKEPLAKPEVTVFTTEISEIPNVAVERGPLPKGNKAMVVIATKILSRPSVSSFQIKLLIFNTL